MTELREYEPPRYCPMVGKTIRLYRRNEFIKKCRGFRFYVHKLCPQIADYCRKCLQEKWLPNDAEIFFIGNKIKFKIPDIEEAWLRRNKKQITGKKKVKMMATKKATCALCNEERTVSLQLGEMVCASCAAVQRYAKSRPDVVIAALAKFDNLPGPGLSEEALRVSADNGKGDLRTRVERVERSVEVFDRFCDFIRSVASVPSCSPGKHSTADHRSV